MHDTYRGTYCDIQLYLKSYVTPALVETEQAQVDTENTVTFNLFVVIPQNSLSRRLIKWYFNI